MFTGGRVTTPSTSLPAGWTAYTDVKTSQTYYVHLPTGDTQWNRPPPPPPPPPRPPQPNPTHPSARSHPFDCSMYTVPVPATIPHSFQFQSHPVPSSAGMLSNGGGSGINTNRLSYHPNSNQTTLPPLPPPTSSFNSISSQSKRSLVPTHHAPKPPPTKRPRVQQTKSHANLITPVISNNSGKWKECSKCKLKKEWPLFSKTQWQYGVSGRCKKCVDETVVDEIEQSRAAVKAAKLSSAAKADINNTTTECFRVQPTPATANNSSGKKAGQPPPPIAVVMIKSCSTCQQRGGKGFFSIRQWPRREDVRKCKSCIKKYLSVQPKASSSSVNLTGKEDAMEGAGTSCAIHGNGEYNNQATNHSLEALAVPVAVMVKQEKSS